jgi:trimethylamine--corrinoid protein Co-methyltransferase
MLSDSDINTIHEKALVILEKAGVYIDSREALELLEKAGCSVDFPRKMARFPRDLVERSLGKAPGSIIMYDRQGSEAARLEGNNVHFDPGSCGVRFQASDGQTVDSCSQHLAAVARLTEHLENLALQSTAITAGDVPKEIADTYRLYIVLRNCHKPVITGAFSVHGVTDMKDLLAAVRGGQSNLEEQPLAVFDICPSPPLKWTHISAQNIIDCARLGLPMEFVSMPMPGAASPATLAGSILVHTAETLSGLTLAQVARPGAPVIWGGAPVVFDMKSGTTPMSAVEATMIGVGSCQMGKAYGLPTHTYACLSDSKVVDTQAGLETATGGMAAALAGINVISGPGMLDFVGTFSLEKLVIDNEICGMALRLASGVQLDEETLAQDLIQSLWPGGDYLKTAHTRKWFRREVYMPGPTVDRHDRRTWEEAGALTSLDTAKAQVEKLLERPTPRIDEETSGSLDAAMARVKSRYSLGSLPLGPS